MVEFLDLKDKKVLFELEQNSRRSLNKIASKVALKKETLFHRLHALEKKGIIKAYLAEINVYKIGYHYYPVLLRFQNTTTKIEGEIFEYLKKSSFVAWLTKCEGAWDITLTLVAKTNLQLSEFFDDFLENYGKYVLEKQVFITTEIHYFKRSFGVEKKPNKTITGSGDKIVELDETDFKVLKLLSTNARMPLVEMGEKLKFDPKTISFRIKRLEKEKIIQGYRVLIDFSKTGYKFYKVWFSLKNLSKENFKSFFGFFEAHPSILWATKIIGSYDLSIEMEVNDVYEFRNVMSEIKSKFSHIIKGHESILIFEESIMNYLPQNY